MSSPLLVSDLANGHSAQCRCFTRAGAVSGIAGPAMSKSSDVAVVQRQFCVHHVWRGHSCVNCFRWLVQFDRRIAEKTPSVATVQSIWRMPLVVGAILWCV